MVEFNSQNPLALKPTIKFVCSYGGRILPRYPDGKLRYHGGETRLLSVDRSVSLSELAVKLGEMCGTAVNLRCQLPTEDLDALVSITSDEDLANLIEEYDRASAAAAAALPPSLKIRAFLFAPKSSGKLPSPPSSASSSSNGSTSPKSPALASSRCLRHAPRPPVHPNAAGRASGKVPVKYAYHFQYGGGNGSRPVYVIHNGSSHWQ